MNYNKKREYDEFIKPELIKLKKLCMTYDIPFFFTVCVKNDENDSVYINDMYSGLAKGMNLTKDYFPNLAKVMVGFETRMPQEKILFEPEELNTDFISELESISNDV